MKNCTVIGRLQATSACQVPALLKICQNMNLKISSNMNTEWKDASKTKVYTEYCATD